MPGEDIPPRRLCVPGPEAAGFLAIAGDYARHMPSCLALPCTVCSELSCGYARNLPRPPSNECPSDVILRKYCIVRVEITLHAGLAQPGGGLALGAQAGEQRLREVLTEAGFTRVRRVAETPANMILEVRA